VYERGKIKYARKLKNERENYEGIEKIAINIEEQ